MYMPGQITNAATAEIDRRDEEAAVDRLHAVLVLGARRDGQDADDRGDHADRAHEQREHDADDRAHLGEPANAAAPRISDATSVTS